MDLENDIDFHDSVLTRATINPTETCLFLESVKTGTQMHEVKVCIQNIHSIVADGTRIDCFSMEGDDGEILTLKKTDRGLHLIVQWEDYSIRKTWTKSYWISGDRVSVQFRNKSGNSF